ncbi:MAG: hypothetical protein NVSMB28_00210 [Collimonas sp.]
MLEFLATLEAIAQILPALNSLVLAAEAIHPGANLGQSKLNTILNTVEGALTATGQAVVTYEQIKPAVVGAVSGIVATYNAAGGFPLPASPNAASATPALLVASVPSAASAGTGSAQ